MKILFASDFHIHPHDDFSFILPDGMNSRLADCLSVIDRVGSLYERYDCDSVVFCGDLFHTPRSVPTDVLQYTYDRLSALARNVKHMVIVAGNHDKGVFAKDATQATSVSIFRDLPNTTVFANKPEVFNCGKVSIAILPYLIGDNVAKEFISLVKGFCSSPANTRNLVVTHAQLAEATCGPNEIRLKSQFKVADWLKTGAVDYILAGHHHHPQRMAEQAITIGSPIQHNMLDRGDKRGIVIYDSKTNTTQRVWLKCNKFFLYEINSEKDLSLVDLPSVKDNYVRVMLRTEVISNDRVRNMLEKAGVRRCEVKLALPKEAHVKDQMLTDQFISCGNVDGIIVAFAEKTCPKELDKTRLVEIGHKIVEKAQ